MDSSSAWPRISGDHVQLAVRIADVGVSAGVNVLKKLLFLCEKFYFFCDNSMVDFLIAFGFMCLQDSGIATRTIIATVCGIILILTFWCIWTSWRNQESCSADIPGRTTLTFEEDRVKDKEKGFTFTRENSDIKSQPAKRPKLRSRTLSTMKTALKVPLQKLRRGSSKKVVEDSEESIVDEIEMSSVSKSKI